MLAFLKGKRTYLVVALGVILNGAYAMGLIPPETLPVINSILGFLGLATLRLGVNGDKN